MRATLLGLVSLLTLSVAGQDIDDDDVPAQCRDVCLDALAVAQRCDQETDDDDAELNCICNAQGAGSFIPNCEACVAQFDDDDDNDNDDDDNDFLDVINSCQFTRATTFTTPMFTIQTGTSTSAQVITTAVDSVSESVTTSSTTITTAGGDDDDDNGSTTVSSTTSTSTSTGTMTTTTTGGSPTPTDNNGPNAAPGLLAPGMGVAGAVLLAAAAIL